MKKEPLLILGAGGHALACIDVVEAEGRHRILGLVGRPEEIGKKVSGYQVLGSDRELPILLRKCRKVLVAIGQIKTSVPRQHLFAQALAMGAIFPVVRSPFSQISPRSFLEAGTIVMHGVVIQSGVIVGKNCILNSQCLIEHDARIGDHCHISTKATLNGGVFVGSGSFVGSGAVVQEKTKLKKNSFVQMGELIRRRS